MVMSRDLPHVGFTLRMVSTQKTFNNPVQQWEFISDYAVKDYTGSYYIKLVPCLANMVWPLINHKRKSTQSNNNLRRLVEKPLNLYQ